MENRSREIEAASGVASLGRLADQVALAAVRFQAGRTLSESDNQALEAAEQMLRRVADLQGPLVTPDVAALHTMAPFGALDETVEAVTSASDAEEEVGGQIVAELVEQVREIRTGDASPDVARKVHEFFDRLSVITLNRSSYLAHAQQGKDLWIREALNS